MLLAKNVLEETVLLLAKIKQRRERWFRSNETWTLEVRLGILKVETMRAG